MTWIRHFLIRWLAGRDAVAINIWFDPYNGVMISGLNPFLVSDVMIRDCHTPITVLGLEYWGQVPLEYRRRVP